jgi:hypothetical protein
LKVEDESFRNLKVRGNVLLRYKNNVSVNLGERVRMKGMHLVRWQKAVRNVRL